MVEGRQEQPGKWSRRVQEQEARPRINLEKIAQAEIEADQLQAAGLKLVQRMLDDLAGLRPTSSDEGKEIVDRVKLLAKRFGTPLLYKGERIYLKWANSVFVATTPDATHQHIASSVEFLPLTVGNPEQAVDAAAKSGAGKPQDTKIPRR